MRVKLLTQITSSYTDIHIVANSGLVSDFALSHHVDFLVRGIRSVKDLESELALAAINKQLGVDTFMVPCDARYAHISSSLVRELALFKRRHPGLMPAEIENEVYDNLIKF